MTETDLVVVVIASLLGSFVKSVTGMGYPQVAIPLLSFFIGVEAAVAVIALPNVVANTMLNLHVRHARHETRDLPVLALTSTAGAVLGTVLLVSVPARPLLIVLAATITAYLLQYLRRPELRLAPATTRRWAPLAGTTAGIMQGSMGISGPVVAMWFHGYRLGKDAYVFSITLLFLLAGVAQLAVLALGGKLDRDRLGASALALMATVTVIPIGTRLRSRLDGQLFERVVLGLLAVSAVSLFIRAMG